MQFAQKLTKFGREVFELYTSGRTDRQKNKQAHLVRTPPA